MEKGKAPRMTIQVLNPKTGKISVKDVSMELHHKFLPQRGGGQAENKAWNLTKATPWGHASMDSYRHTGYKLIKVIKGTNSW